MGYIITYGIGGYDETKPNNNIISIEETPDKPSTPIEGEVIEEA